MNIRLYAIAAILASASLASGQMASHSPVASHSSTTEASSNPKIADLAAKPVVRVNGAVLSEIDLLREMYAIFPYAQQHGGFPKALEADMRKGALEMIVFEELLYQEAKRRNLTVATEKLTRALASFRARFPNKAAYETYVSAEGRGDPAVVREKIRRSLLIERMLKIEVKEKSLVTLADAKAYYDKNTKEFAHDETFSIQTISIIPPENPSKELQVEARAKIKDALRLARNTKTSREFGLLAEQISDDDWRMKLGDRGMTEASKLPPEVVKAARTLKPGQISESIALGRAYVIFRLNAHSAAGKAPFAQVQKKVRADLQEQRIATTRAALNQKLHQGAKIEIL